MGVTSYHCPLFRRCFFFLFGPLIVGSFPSLIWIVAIHLFKGLQRLRSEVLLINNSVRTDNEGLHSCNAILSRRRRQREPPDHGVSDDEIHLAHRSSRPLPFQHLEIVAMERLAFFRVTFLQRFRDRFSYWAFPIAIRILPSQ